MAHITDYSRPVAKDNFRLNKVHTDIVIIGSSRCNHHYVTTMLRDSINNYTGGGYSLYNGGIDGKFLNSNSCAVESVMDRYSPDMIIFEASEFDLNSDRVERDINFSSHLYNSNRFVKQYNDALGWLQRVKCISNLFRYNNKVSQIASSFFFPKDDDTGYEPLYNEMTIIPKRLVAETVETDKYTIDNFSRMLNTAADKGIRLVVVTSPMFNPTNSNKMLASLCAEHNTPYIELYNLEPFNSHPEYFYDEYHLNDKGAHIYTAMFFDALKPYLADLNTSDSYQQE